MTMIDDPGTLASDEDWANVTILLVEDNALDARSTVRAAQELGVGRLVEVVTDGQAALDRLRTERSDREPIGLVLLDLNLPGKDGHDVLDEIRADESLSATPVVILTSSHEATDVRGAYRRGANAYVTKPTGLADWFRTMATIREFWLSLAVLPRP